MNITKMDWIIDKAHPNIVSLVDLNNTLSYTKRGASHLLYGLSGPMYGHLSTDPSCYKPVLK